MDISKIDKNFAIKKEVIKDGIRFFTIPHPSIDLYGVHFDENENAYLRLPKSVAKETSFGVDAQNNMPAGARIRFSTNANKFYFKVNFPWLSKMNNMSRMAASGFVLIDETDDCNNFQAIFMPDINDEHGFERSTTLKGGKMRDYILYFPTYNCVNTVTIGFNADAIVTNGKKYRDILPIMYYGSSITQGASASRPDTCYQAYVSKWNNVDFINFGYSGCAKGEDAIVDYMATVPCSIFVVDYDHNAPDAEYLNKTHYPIYEKFRKNFPTTPIIFMSKPDCDTKPLYKQCLKVIKNTYKKGKELGDNNVYLIEGKKLFSKCDRECCFVDGCHPNDLGFYRMAQALNKVIKKII